MFDHNSLYHSLIVEMNNWSHTRVRDSYIIGRSSVFMWSGTTKQCPPLLPSGM